MDFTGRIDVLEFDTDAAAHHGEIRATLERQGQTIGPYDLMIAGHARSRGLVVVTGNLRKFTRVDPRGRVAVRGLVNLKRQAVGPSATPCGRAAQAPAARRPAPPPLSTDCPPGNG